MKTSKLWELSVVCE